MGKSLASHISWNGLHKLLLKSYCFRSRASIFVFVISIQQKFVMATWPLSIEQLARATILSILYQSCLGVFYPVIRKKQVVSNVNILSSLSLQFVELWPDSQTFKKDVRILDHKTNWLFSIEIHIEHKLEVIRDHRHPFLWINIILDYKTMTNSPRKTFPRMVCGETALHIFL